MSRMRAGPLEGGGAERAGVRDRPVVGHRDVLFFPALPPGRVHSRSPPPSEDPYPRSCVVLRVTVSD